MPKIEVAPIKRPVIPSELVEFLKKYDNYIIAGHKEPDGDCIGSSIAMSLLLKRFDKTTFLMSAGPFKRTEIKKFETLFSEHLPSNHKFTPENTGLVIVDCSGFDRIGDIAGEVENFPFVIIDHHATNTETSPSSLVMPTAPSTTYIIQVLIEEIAGKVSDEEAEALFFGLCTDTGFFRHLDERSANVFEQASRLVDAGCNPKKHFMQMNGNKPFESRLLIARILNRMQKHYGGKLIVSYELLSDRDEFGLEGRDSDMLYQLIQSIEGVEAICIIRQESPENCSIGFRSLDKVDVSKIATNFGGGGHKQASGAYVEGFVDDLLPKVVEAFKSQMQNL